MAGAKTNEQLTNELKVLRTKVEALQDLLAELKQDINSRPQLSDIARSEASLNGKINDNAELINDLETRLSTVIVPEDTRYYLSQSEVADFRSNFAKLLAMISTFDALYKNLVAYSANLESST